MDANMGMERRQLWVPDELGDTAKIPDILSNKAHLCQSINLPSGGVLLIPGSDPITLMSDAAFKPSCVTGTQPAIIAGNGGAVDLAEVAGGAGINIDESIDAGPQFSDFRDPFYASIFPQCYALAATTVVAYTLVIMLFITPRSFLDGGVVVLGRRGFTNGGTGGQNIGGRPWLQKVAALTVAISLTIATTNTFRVAETQYSFSFQNAKQLQQEVLGGTELKIIRLISDTFLWLAQAQTLIRLFPRQREKIIIKWTAFSLITLDLIFDTLNSFYATNAGSLRPRNFTDPIPALSYLFQLSLGVLYAAWVIYYSLMKKRYAFYHPQMRNMCLVAVLSLIALLVPVVFFVLDISKPEFTGWGDYVRWVGAAAASVIVWEWVERIEALEREEKKDGILGREVFDGDEMMDVTPSEFSWPRKRKSRRPGGDVDDGGESGGGPRTSNPSSTGKSHIRATMSSMVQRYRSRSSDGRAPDTDSPGTNNPRSGSRHLQPPLWPARPAPAVTPVSRTDTASADSTVYAIRYHPLTETTSRTTEHLTPPPPPQGQLSRSNSSASSDHGQARSSTIPVSASEPLEQENASAKRWRALAQAMPFRRGPRETTPAEQRSGPGNQVQHEETSKWDFRSRLEEFAVSQAEKLRERIRPSVDTDSLPVLVIPAPQRRGAALAQVLEEEENSLQSSPNRADTRNGSGSRTSPTAMGSSTGPLSPILWRSNSALSSTSVTQGAAVLPTVRRAQPPPAESSSPSAEVGPRGPSQVALDKRPAETPPGDGQNST